jgi:hypothetical protein
MTTRVHFYAALCSLAIAGAYALPQSSPTTAPSDLRAEVERLREENTALRKALQEVAPAPATQPIVDFQRRFNAVKLERDRFMEQLAIAQEQITRLERELEALRRGAKQPPPAGQ